MSSEKKLTPILFLIAVGVLLYALSIYKQVDSYEKVFVVYDQSKLGEKAMVTASVEALKIQRPKAEIIIKPNAKASELNLEDSVHCILITAGQFGIDLIRSAKIPNRMKILLCTHQWFDDMNKLRNLVTTHQN